MGTVISKAANGIGTLLGNAFVAPFKSVFGGSCEDVCSETWDVICFIEHLCVSNIMKLLLVFGLCYITFLVFYLMFKIGICQCVARSLCKMCWAGCETYWFAMEDITCFLWHKLINIKRVNRRRRHRYFHDIEVGSSSTTSEYNRTFGADQSVNASLNFGRKRKDRPRRSSYYHHHRLRLKRRDPSARFRGKSRRINQPRQLRMRRSHDIQTRELAIFKKRRIR